MDRTVVEIPAGSLTIPGGQFRQPDALTPEVMVFFMTMCFLGMVTVLKRG